MFVLKNKLGTAYIETKSELRRDDLIKRGWILVKKEQNLEKMKKEELEKYAADNGIDISSAKTKTEILDIITGKLQAN